MKSRFFLPAVLLTLAVYVQAQPTEPCSTTQKLQQIFETDPSAAVRFEQMQGELRNYISNESARQDRNVIVTIPVVFHVIHGGQPLGNGLNIDTAQINSQIDVLNECYRLRNADTSLIPSWFQGRQADIEVEFCLASYDPQGFSSSGITRHLYTNIVNFDTDIKPVTQWDPTKYLNIWTTNLGTTLLGYATFPTMGPANQDGVVLDYRHVGKAPANPNASSHDLGRTAVHEVGHWLMLYHTFQDSCKGMTPQTCHLQGDMICDTPPEKEATYGQPNLVQNTCNESPVDEYDMWMNYMDYADDDQLHLFTHDQREVMRATLNTYRLSLQSSMGCTNTANTFTYSGKVVDAADNTGVNSARILFDGQQDYEVTANASGDFIINNLIEGYYDVYAGKWGYLTKQYSLNVYYTAASAAITIPIQNHHYYDDFLMNYSWTTYNSSSGGLFVRDIPQGTVYGTDASNPNSDLADDFGLKCFVTGNNGSSVAANDDVDFGSSSLTSPAFDVSGYTDPYIRYSRWFFDGSENGNVPDDVMSIKINNGSQQVVLENVSSSANQWTPRQFRISDFITPTNNMRLIVDVSDLSLGNPNIVEGALDKFEVLEASILSVNELEAIQNLSVYPNPSNGVLHVKFNNPTEESVQVSILNMLGEIVATKPAEKLLQHDVVFDLSNQPQGLYLVRLKTEHSEKTLKFSLLR